MPFTCTSLGLIVVRCTQQSPHLLFAVLLSAQEAGCVRSCCILAWTPLGLLCCWGCHAFLLDSTRRVCYSYSTTEDRIIQSSLGLSGLVCDVEHVQLSPGSFSTPDFGCHADCVGINLLHWACSLCTFLCLVLVFEANST